MRNVIVTGATRGLGLGIAAALARDGFHVVAIARKPSEALEAAAAEAGAGRITFVPCDLGAIDALPPLVRAIRKDHGPIYGLVNNAGIGTEGLLATMPNGRIEELLRINVLSPITLSKYVVRNMMSDREGRIVNVSSIVASTGYNALSVYSATKAALIGFTRSLAREAGPLGITVNAIAPGFVDTELTSNLPADERERIVRRSALRRLPEVADVAATVGFLLGPGGRNVTGTVVTVDAGATA